MDREKQIAGKCAHMIALAEHTKPHKTWIIYQASQSFGWRTQTSAASR